MKYTLLLFLLLLTLSYASIGQSVPKGRNLVDTKGQRQGEWVITYKSGWRKSTNPDSIAYYRLIEYADSKVKGKIRAYRRNGTLQWTGNFLSEDLDCASGCETCLCQDTSTFYHEDGKTVMYQGVYEKGVLNGFYTAYYANGQMQLKMVYRQGKQDGSFVAYHENGKNYLVGDYTNGLRIGIWQEFTEDGSLKEEVNHTQRIANHITEELNQGIAHFQNKEYAQCLEKIEPYDNFYRLAFKDDKQQLKAFLTLLYKCYQETGQTEKVAQMKEEIQQVE